jgi:hypothetical protein
MIVENKVVKAYQIVKTMNKNKCTPDKIKGYRAGEKQETIAR